MTIILDEALAEQARRLGVDISAAARDGVATAVREAMARVDRTAYETNPEMPDPFWDEAEAWGSR